MAAASRLILLTGAAGFVGRQVLRALGERGCRVRSVVREGKQERFAHDDAIETIVASRDIFAESAAWWARACGGVDTVIHAAWYAESGQYLQSPKNQECLSGTLRLAEGAVQAKVRRFVGIGTCFEYDLDAGRLSIKTPLKPSTPYAQAKVDAFNALSVALPRHGVAFAWCRLFYLYGEGEDSRRFAVRIEHAVAALADEASTDWYMARLRSHHDATPTLAGPEGSSWRRAWALGDRSRKRRRQTREWPKL